MLNDLPPRVRRHRFSKEILASVQSCSVSDGWHGLLEVMEHWLVIAGAVAVSLLAWQELPLLPAALIYASAVFLIGGRQRGLAGVLHQACHGTLMTNFRVGRVVGTLFGGYPVLQSFSGYRASHVADHHGRFGDPDDDPDYLQYQRNGLCGANLGRAAMLRHLRSLPGPRATLSYLRYLIRDRILAARESPAERWTRLALFAGVIAVSAVTGWLPAFAAYWLVPLVTTQVWIGAVAELLEHYPVIETAPRIDIRMSWNRRIHPFVRFLLGEKEGEGFHLVHHLFPHVPLWRLKEVDAILQRDPHYAALPRLAGIFAGINSIMEALPSPAVPREAA